MDLHLQDKVVIVTGGGKGIGSGIVLQLAREGAIPIIFTRSPLSAEFTEQLQAITERYEFHQLDLNETDQIQPLVDEIGKRYGGIFAIVNNAGANDNKDLETTTWQEYEQSLHGNLTHYYALVHSALPYLRQCEGANILNIASKTALTGQGKTSAYASAKGAQLALTREWAAALAKYNIRANALVVSECFTPLYANWIKTFGDEAAQKAQLAKIECNIPLYQRMTTIEEIGDTAVFLLSPRSSHTTGQWVYVDGGYVHLDRALTAS